MKWLDREFGMNISSQEDKVFMELKETLITLYNMVSEEKEKEIMELKAIGIVPAVYTNESVTNAVSGMLTKEKIIVDSSSLQLIQVMDPIFKIPENSFLKSSIGAHFYSPFSYLE